MYRNIYCFICAKENDTLTNYHTNLVHKNRGAIKLFIDEFKYSYR